jgi:hypothetical protein
VDKHNNAAAFLTVRVVDAARDRRRADRHILYGPNLGDGGAWDRGAVDLLANGQNSIALLWGKPGNSGGVACGQAEHTECERRKTGGGGVCQCGVPASGKVTEGNTVRMYRSLLPQV